MTLKAVGAYLLVALYLTGFLFIVWDDDSPFRPWLAAAFIALGVFSLIRRTQPDVHAQPPQTMKIATIERVTLGVAMLLYGVDLIWSGHYVGAPVVLLIAWPVVLKYFRPTAAPVNP